MLLPSLIALALPVFMNPQVGQRVEFLLTEPDQSYLWSREIVKVEPSRLSLRGMKLYPGSSEWEDPRFSFWKREQLQRTQDLLEHCEEQGGVRETIQVPAGTFDTCQVVTENGSYRKVTYWWGDAPVIGLVKREIVLPILNGDPLVQTVELLSR